MKKLKVRDWESHLVQRAQAGDSVAFEWICELHRPAMLRLATRLLRNRDDANDAVQEALLKGLRSLADFEIGRPVRPWLLRICANCCVDLMRYRRQPHEALDWHEHALADGAVSTDVAAEHALEAAQLRSAVDRLPAQYKRIILMRHYRHMEVAEIAEALDKPEGTIKSWLFRARALLRQDLAVAMG
jgi:RNA polymerase sigma-70 factor (ECF subfamily)